MMSPGIKQARRAGQHEPCQAAHRQDAGGGWGSCTMVRDMMHTSMMDEEQDGGGGR